MHHTPRRCRAPLFVPPLPHVPSSAAWCSLSPPFLASAREKPKRCSRCGALGHNVRTCPLPSQVHATSPTRKGSPWFRQRCSACGEPGHNARACPERRRLACRVCRGTARLPCSQCRGRGFALSALPSPMPIAPAPAPPAAQHQHHLPSPTVWLTPEQKRLADAARSRARFIGRAIEREDHEAPEDPVDQLVGGLSVEHVRQGGAGRRDDGPGLRCARCLGRGYLSCMACSAE